MLYIGKCGGGDRDRGNSMVAVVRTNEVDLDYAECKGQERNRLLADARHILKDVSSTQEAFSTCCGLEYI